MPRLTPAQAIARNLEDCDRNVAARRENIATALEIGSGAYRLSTVVNELATAEGERDLWFQLKTESDHHGGQLTGSHANRFVMYLLSRGPEDSWSGRNNDVKRASFDGTRSAARRLGTIFPT
jgi:hypothetical protein